MYELIIIFALILLNGALAMSEIAFVSVKKYKIEESAKKGNRSAKKALLLLKEPEKFLSAIQIGITLIGILAGAFGGYAMSEDIRPFFENISFLKKYSLEISFFIIVTFITYLSLVFGELAPKSFALNYSEKITLFMAPIMSAITIIFRPFVNFLSFSTKILLLIIRVKKSEEPPVTEEELKSLLALGTSHGTFEKEESEIIKKVFRFNDKKVTAIMVPRTEIEWIDSSMTNQEIFDYMCTHHHSRYIVGNESIDHIKGYIESKDFLINYNLNPTFNINNIINEILVVPEFIYTIDILEKFRLQKTNIALIVDEYGGSMGIITLHDLIEDIFGDLPEKYEESEQEIIKRKDGTFLVDGSTEISKIVDLFSIEIDSTEYTTISGFIMYKLGRIPTEGDIVKYGAYEFEVVDMDGKRVDKIIISKVDDNLITDIS